MTNENIIRIIKEGYWERTAVVNGTDGQPRIRKESRSNKAENQPWARLSLLREINYLKSLEGSAAALFPEFLGSWGEENKRGPIGYEMTFLDGWTDLGDLLQQGHVDHRIIKTLEKNMASMLFNVLYIEQKPSEMLSTHIETAVELAMQHLCGKRELAAIIESGSISINGLAVPGLRHSFDAGRRQGILERLNNGPQVRLHGDLIPENVLIPRSSPLQADELLFIDPVSVAGVSTGHPLFDLVKYESYAQGDLFAIRSGALTATPHANDERLFQLDLKHPEPALENFSRAHLGESLRLEYTRCYGKPDPNLEHLLLGYFSLVMAINTTGNQPLTRTLDAARNWAKLS